MITYVLDKNQQAIHVAEVFKKSGIKRPYEDLARIQRMIVHSDILVTAWDGEKMIGVARAITDYSYCCYLSDLAVDLDYQKQGIGRELLSRVQTEIGDECSIVLISSPIATEYYPRLGFVQSDRAYVIARKK